MWRQPSPIAVTAAATTLIVLLSVTVFAQQPYGGVYSSGTYSPERVGFPQQHHPAAHYAVAVALPKVVSFEGATGRAIPIVNSNVTLYPALPKRFRATTPAFLSAAQQTQSVDVRGLFDIGMSGSAQYSPSEFESVATWLGIDDVWVVDLRQEPHGFLNDAIAFSWFGARDWATYGITSLDAVQELQRRLLDTMAAQQHAILYDVTLDADDERVVAQVPVTYPVEQVTDEAHIVTTRRPTFHYFHVPVVDHIPPSPRAVGQFDAIVRALAVARTHNAATVVERQEQHQQNVPIISSSPLPVRTSGIGNGPWIHFHCAQGDGRTTLFMAMLDCVMNIPRGITMDAIIRRQAVLGGIDLATPPNNWKRPFFAERLQFLREFCMRQQPPQPRALYHHN